MSSKMVATVAAILEFTTEREFVKKFLKLYVFHARHEEYDKHFAAFVSFFKFFSS